MNDPTSRKILVWDAPVRVFHWLLAISFVGAYVTAESERWRMVHVTLGYTAGGLVLWRVLWGLLGTRHARFAGFVRGPGTVLRYLRSLPGGAPEHHVGHNPAGGWAIVALLAGVAAIALSGLALDNGWAGKAFEDVHEVLANLTLALVLVHVAGVVVSSRLHGENLVAAMVSGRKAGPAGQAIARAWRGVAALMLVAVLGFWTLQWTTAPDGATLALTRSGGHKQHEGHHDRHRH